VGVVADEDVAADAVADEDVSADAVADAVQEKHLRRQQAHVSCVGNGMQVFNRSQRGPC
jgi:hypothetical protein